MRGITDASIWDYAKEHGFAIVSKDNDFRQRAFVYGAPPQVIWLSIGNASTKAVAELLRSRVARIQSFIQDSSDSMLVLRSG
jgi:predicted nuclease of predicted toxin-antitoxin system